MYCRKQRNTFTWTQKKGKQNYIKKATLSYIFSDFINIKNNESLFKIHYNLPTHSVSYTLKRTYQFAYSVNRSVCCCCFLNSCYCNFDFFFSFGLNFCLILLMNATVIIFSVILLLNSAKIFFGNVFQINHGQNLHNHITACSEIYCTKLTYNDKFIIHACRTIKEKTQIFYSIPFVHKKYTKILAFLFLNLRNPMSFCLLQHVI